MRKAFLLSLFIVANTSSLSAQLSTLPVIQEQYLRQETLDISSLENKLSQFNALIADAKTLEDKKLIQEELQELNLEARLRDLKASLERESGVFDLYFLTDPQRNQVPQTVIPTTALADDLYITCGPVEKTSTSLSYKSEQRLVNYLLRSQDGTPFYSTQLGKIKLLKTLGEATASIEQLNKKRNLHLFLRENPSIVEELRGIMTRIKDLESDILTFWNKKETAGLIRTTTYVSQEAAKFLSQETIDAINTSSISNLGDVTINTIGLGNGLVTGKKFLQEVAAIVSQYALSDITSLVTPTQIATVATFVASYLSCTYFPRDKKNVPYSNKIFFALVAAATAYCLLNPLSMATLSSIPSTVVSVVRQMQSLPLIISPYFFKLRHMTFMLYSNPAQCFYTKTNIINQQNIALQSVAKLISEMKKLKRIIDFYPELSENLELHAHLNVKQSVEQQVSSQESQDDFTSLFAVLDGYNPNKTGYKDQSFISKLWNRVAYTSIPTAYRTMHSFKKYFGLSLEAIGEIDMYLTLNNLLSYYQDKKLRFCIVKFKGTGKPYLRAKKAWNPLLLANNNDMEFIVPNTIKLGGKVEPRIAIVSGSTEGGKSTFLRTIISGAYTAITLGIAPAEEFVMNPPKKICIALNNQDNIGESASGFKSEITTMKNIIDTIKATNGNCLVCIDEIFQRVQTESGETGSYRTIKDSIFPQKNALSIIVTHRKSPKTLAEEHPREYKNYYFKKQDHHLFKGKTPVNATEEKDDNLQKLLQAGLITQESYSEVMAAQAA